MLDNPFIQYIGSAQKELHFGFLKWELETRSESWSSGIYQLLEADENRTEYPLGAFFRCASTDQVPDINASLLPQLKLGNIYEGEFNIVTTSGRNIVVSCSARPSNEERSEWIVLVNDITLKNQMEGTRRILGHSNRQLEEFASVASHDLQEPLRKLVIYSNRLFENLCDSINEENITVLNRIQQSARNMQLLIDNLLQYAKVGTDADRFYLTDLNEVMRHVLIEQELKIEESHTVIDVGELPVIEAYEPQMKQLFNNLVNNSLKFSNKTAHPEIIVRASILPDQDKIGLGLANGKQYYCISFTDNGIGFDNQYAERIFLTFQRLNSKWEYPGTGMGLSICRKIVETHNGLLKAESIPNVATTFTVILPFHQPS